MDDKLKNYKFAGMMPFLALDDLKNIFLNREGALEDHILRTSTGALRLFRSEHLPLMLLFPFFSFLSPIRWITGGKINFMMDLAFPVILVSAVLIVAMIFDKIMEHSAGPGVEKGEPDKRKNLSLFLHLSLMSSAGFFIFHYALGMMMTAVSILLAVILSIRAQSIYRSITPARALVYYLWSVVFAMVPAMAAAAALNILHSIDLMGDLI